MTEQSIFGFHYWAEVLFRLISKVVLNKPGDFDGLLLNNYLFLFYTVACWIPSSITGRIMTSSLPWRSCSGYEVCKPAIASTAELLPPEMWISYRQAKADFVFGTFLGDNSPTVDKNVGISILRGKTDSSSAIIRKYRDYLSLTLCNVWNVKDTITDFPQKIINKISILASVKLFNCRFKALSEWIDSWI